MAVDTVNFFNQQLPAGMTHNPSAVQQIDGKFQIIVGGSGGGEWFVDASASGPNYTNASAQATKADVTIFMAPEDFQRLLDNPKANFMQLFFAGKVKCTGNTHLAMKLPDLVMLASK